MKVYDCFTFFNELDLLDIRMSLLNAVVDYFVIVEGGKSHTGKLKSYLFEENVERFEKYKHKIIYVKVDDMPDYSEEDISSDGNNWRLENFQRDCIVRGLTRAKDDDVILVSDVDEIPNPSIIKEYKANNETEIWVLEMYMMYYFFNCLNISEPIWRSGTRIAKYKEVKAPKQRLSDKPYYHFSEVGSPNYFRFCKGKLISGGGWHFSYCGGVDMLFKKLTSISEQHLGNEKISKQQISKDVAKGRDILGRSGYRYLAFRPKKYLPEALCILQKDYPHLFFIQPTRYFILNDMKYFFYRCKRKLGLC